MILVSILGDFYSSILPVFFNFKEKITKHILVYDDFKRDTQRAKEIQKGLLAFKKKYNYKFQLEEYIVDEDSYEALKKCADTILLKTKNPKDIYINTTDGFSTITTILNYHLYQKGVNFISYDMFDNEFDILNLNGMKKESISNNLNIKDHFLLKGYSYKAKDIKTFANKHENSIKEIFEIHHEEYNSFLSINPNRFFTVKSVPNSFSHIKSILYKMGLKDSKKSDSLITGGLFELYIYNLVKNLNFDDIEVGFTVERLYGSTYIPNEFDILIMKNNHLHMIECKFLNKIQKDSLVYKYIALSNILDEDGEMLIVTKEKISNDALKSKIPTVEKRGRLSNITFAGGVHLNPQIFTMQIKTIFGL